MNKYNTLIFRFFRTSEWDDKTDTQAGGLCIFPSLLMQTLESSYTRKQYVYMA